MASATFPITSVALYSGIADVVNTFARTAMMFACIIYNILPIKLFFSYIICCACILVYIFIQSFTYK